MPFQTQRLRMYARGVSDDPPSDGIREKLVDGIHLRWFFESSLGFPRYGFHLFRRPSGLASAEARCLATELSSLPAGPWPAAILDTSLGRIDSDANFVLTDEFSWKWSLVFWHIGRIGIVLQDHPFLRVALPVVPPPSAEDSPVTAVDVRIGFRQNHGIVGERIEFWHAPPSTGPNPRIEKGVAFRVLDDPRPPDMAPGMSGDLDSSAIPRPQTEIVQDASDPPISGLDVHDLVEISLPLPATGIWFTLNGMHPSIDAFDENGALLGHQSWQFAEGAILSSGSFFARGIRRLVLRGASVLHTFTFETEAHTTDGVLVRALHGDAVVAQSIVQGLAGQVITARLQPDVPVTEVQINSGPAVLLDVCLIVPDQRGVRDGWQLIKDFPYPLSLPVAHPDYPASGHKPVDEAWAQTEAFGRVRYGSPAPWTGDGFADLHAQMIALVENGRSPPMAERSTLVLGTPATPDPGATQPVSLRRYPLDTVLLAALHPAVAQMVGLYWVDQTAQAGQIYDYLLLAEWNPIEIPEFASRDPNQVLDKLHREGVAEMDGYIAFAKRVGPPEALPFPRDLQAFALPGGTLRAQDGGLIRAENVAGLRWDLGTTASGQLNVDASILYHLWRADLGLEAPSAPPPSEQYRCLTVGRPILVSSPAPGAAAVEYQNASWPPFRLYAFDRGLADGWYSYQVSGMDIFGRHSARSRPAEWQHHPFAVHFVDRTPPPPPVAVESWALDPKDRTLLRDAAYEAWRAALAPEERDVVVGLRVRWEWPESHARQAPDAREFRIYLQPGRSNAVGGIVRTVEGSDPQDSFVEVDLPGGVAGIALPGTILQVASRAFTVVDGEPGPPTSLHVRGSPPARGPCVLVIPPGHPSYIDYRTPTVWQERYHVVGLGEHVTQGIGPDGRPVRRYEILLPAAGDAFRAGLAAALPVSSAAPISYALIGVSVADGTDDVSDAPRWSAGRWGDRAGNEGCVSAPATIFQVFRGKPPPPELAAYGAERLFATRADYHNRSIFTFRWVAPTAGRTHVLRALDDTLFKTDWLIRSTRAALDPADKAHEPLFPPEWAQPRRQAVAAQLNQIASQAAYPGLTDDARTVLARLPGNEGRVWGQGLAERDWEVRRTRAALSTTDAALFPAELGNSQTLQDAVAALNAITSATAYAGLTNNALRVLASLPGNEAAFSQLTVAPIDPDDPAAADHRGPDSPDSYAAMPTLRAYEDTLDGRSRNRYFYRARSVNTVHTPGDLSLSTPPVYCPDVTPPRTPVVTKVTAGDRKITISWASNREPGMLEYRVYRADSAGAARDLRLMELAGTIPADPDPRARAAAVTWTDSPIPGLVDRWYRLAAVSHPDPTDQRASYGNVSMASPAVRARGTQPAVVAPVLAAPAWDAAHISVRLSWTMADPFLAPYVERRRDEGTPWVVAVAGLAIGATTANDAPDDPTVGYEYRIRVKDHVGQQAVSNSMVTT